MVDLLRRNGLGALSQLRSEMDRAFEGFLGGAPAGWGGWGGREFPAVNLWEDAETVFAEFELPGLGMADVELLAAGSELTLKGERKGREEGNVAYHRRERGTGPFSRVVRLPVEVEPEGVEASLEGGVLTVRMPKAKDARPRRIEVKSRS